MKIELSMVNSNNNVSAEFFDTIGNVVDVEIGGELCLVLNEAQARRLKRVLDHLLPSSAYEGEDDCCTRVRVSKNYE